jgi:hypothetical protein
MSDPPVYLDTSACVREAEADCQNPTQRNTHAGGPVANLYGDTSRSAALSPLTLLEFHNTLATRWRSNNSEDQEFDQAWVEKAQVRIMDLIASGRLIVRSLPPRAAEHAMTLVTLATRDHGNALRTWDAIHLIVAAGWAHELNQQVELWTTDRGFVRFVDLFPHFGQLVLVRNLDD